MDETVTLVSILTEAAPLGLAVILLGLIVLVTLMVILRVVVPALRTTIGMFDAQRTAWEKLVDAQNRFHTGLLEDLELRVDELERELELRDAQITTLEVEVGQLREDNRRKDQLIGDLKRELEAVKTDRDRVEGERDELRQRIEALERKQAERAA
jgi:chromosome segregation ATPase